jgi:zinc transporter, ZIP family
MMEQNSVVLWSLWTGILSALATGLGAIPVHYVKNNSKVLRAFSCSFAGGMMISASVFSLAQEGISLKARVPGAPYMVILGLLLGSLFFWYTEKIIRTHDTKSIERSQGFSKRSLLIFIVMFLHSIPEGIAIGVGFATGNFQFGLVMAIAIAVHNIPEGIAISLPLKAEKVSTARCAWTSILSSIPQPIMAVPAAIVAWMFEPLLPLGLGFAGGAMIHMTICELLPEAIKEGGRSLTAWGVMLGLCTMLLITNVLDLIPIPY